MGASPTPLHLMDPLRDGKQQREALEKLVAQGATRLAEHDETRRRELIADISSRLERVCSHLARDEFAVLVSQIAAVTLRYENRLFSGPPDVKRPTE